MRKDQTGHLDVDQIARAVIDEVDLAPTERDHLENCPVCADAKQRLVRQLQGFSDAARRYTPYQQHKVILPAFEARTGTEWPGRWYLGFAGAAASLALILALLWPHLFTRGALPGTNVEIAREMAADAKLIADIQDLEEDGLPASFREIVPDRSTMEDDDFLDFVVPVDTDFQPMNST
jgi:hypothetical protein